jgi:CBS-domain-containing membrane protein
MRVAEVMSRNVQLASPEDKVQEIAKRMVSDDVGFMPVGDKDRLVGTITDRDIVARAVAKGRDGKCKVRDVMSNDIKYCYDDEDVEHVIRNLGDLQLRRLPVVNREKRLVGVVSLADAARKVDPAGAGTGLSEITAPGGQHSQSRKH